MRLRRKTETKDQGQRERAEDKIQKTEILYRRQRIGDRDWVRLKLNLRLRLRLRLGQRLRPDIG